LLNVMLDFGLDRLQTTREINIGKDPMLVSCLTARKINAVHRILYSAISSSAAGSSASGDIIDQYLRASSSDERLTHFEGIVTSLPNPNSSARQHVRALLSGSAKDIRLAMRMREDALTYLQSPPLSTGTGMGKEAITAVERAAYEWLESAFGEEIVQLRRITFEDSSGQILQTVVRSEVVHRVRSLEALKQRLSNGKRCFSLMHPALPTEPLAFIHVALGGATARNMLDIENSKSDENPLSASFYSVNSVHKALGGLDIACKLIVRAKAELQQEFPTLKKFYTLSPIPGLMGFLSKGDSGLQIGKEERQGKKCLPEDIRQGLERAFDASGVPTSMRSGNVLSDLHSLVLTSLTNVTGYSSAVSPLWVENADLVEVLKEPMLYLSAHYLVHAKARSGASPLDPVARFHLRNGARIEHLNYLGCTSINSLLQSAGCQVNYRYADYSENISETLVSSVLVGDDIKNILRL